MNVCMVPSMDFVTCAGETPVLQFGGEVSADGNAVGFAAELEAVTEQCRQQSGETAKLAKPMAQSMLHESVKQSENSGATAKVEVLDAYNGLEFDNGFATTNVASSVSGESLEKFGHPENSVKVIVPSRLPWKELKASAVNGKASQVGSVVEEKQTSAALPTVLKTVSSIVAKTALSIVKTAIVDEKALPTSLVGWTAETKLEVPVQAQVTAVEATKMQEMSEMSEIVRACPCDNPCEHTPAEQALLPTVAQGQASVLGESQNVVQIPPQNVAITLKCDKLVGIEIEVEKREISINPVSSFQFAVKKAAERITEITKNISDSVSENVSKAQGESKSAKTAESVEAVEHVEVAEVFEIPFMSAQSDVAVPVRNVEVVEVAEMEIKVAETPKLEKPVRAEAVKVVETAKTERVTEAPKLENPVKAEAVKVVETAKTERVAETSTLEKSVKAEVVKAVETVKTESVAETPKFEKPEKIEVAERVERVEVAKTEVKVVEAPKLEKAVKAEVVETTKMEAKVAETPRLEVTEKAVKAEVVETTKTEIKVAETPKLEKPEKAVKAEVVETIKTEVKVAETPKLERSEKTVKVEAVNVVEMAKTEVKVAEAPKIEVKTEATAKLGEANVPITQAYVPESVIVSGHKVAVQVGSAIHEVVEKVKVVLFNQTSEMPQTSQAQQTPQTQPVQTTAQVMQTAQTAQTQPIQPLQPGVKSEFKITLTPEHLGKVTVKIVTDGANMAVRIVTATAEARDLLLSRANSVKVMVEMTGVKVQRYEVVNETLPSQTNQTAQTQTANGSENTGHASRDNSSNEHGQRQSQEQETGQNENGGNSDETTISFIDFAELLHTMS